MFLPGAVLILLKPLCPFYHIQTRQSVTMEVFQQGMRSKEKGEDKQEVTSATEDRTLRTNVFLFTCKCPCTSGSFSYFSKCAGKCSAYTEPNFLHIVYILHKRFERRHNYYY